DGTISWQDVNDELFNLYGDEKSPEIERKYVNRELSYKKAISRHYQRIRITEEQFKEFVYNKIELDPYFKPFYQKVIEKEFPFAIVSSGFENYIELLFQREGIQFKKEMLYANRLLFNSDKITPVFADDNEDCPKNISACGNCKYNIIKKYRKKGDYLIYIGDGHTDFCAAEEVDLLFAKKGCSLYKHCQAYDIDNIGFKDYGQISEYLKKDGLI
ncbi:MAG TPA: MtnX-like HAD-IB family phosphatase, partial [Halanaerobiales bacterium]|nr:MtnX-like HAD-IB family phosphatase [Halanaerobiales bacterium]